MDQLRAWTSNPDRKLPAEAVSNIDINEQTLEQPYRDLVHLCRLAQSPDANEKIKQYLQSPHPEICIRAALEHYTGPDLTQLERRTFWRYQHGMPIEIDASPELWAEAVEMLRPKLEKTGKLTSQARPNINFTLPVVPYVDLKFESWLVEGMIDSPHYEEQWTFIVPTTLNLIDSSDYSLKVKGARMCARLAEKARAKLESTGLIPVFWDALILLLSYLPPAVEPLDAEKLQKAAVRALLALATEREQLNFIFTKGPLSAMQHTNNNVELLISTFQNLELVVKKAQLLSVVHLQAIVQNFRSVLSDPFIDASPQLIAQACQTMQVTMSVCSPRVGAYAYDILYGVAKAKAWDTPLAKDLAALGLDVDAIRLKVEQ